MAEAAPPVAKRRTRVSRPYPQHRLEEVLEIARSIQEKNAGLPFDRVRLAKSMGTTPSSSAFMMKLNSSSKYRLTEGGYSDARISLTELGTRAAQADPEALVEAAMRPETFKAFYELLGRQAHSWPGRGIRDRRGRYRHSGASDSRVSGHCGGQRRTGRHRHGGWQFALR